MRTLIPLALVMGLAAAAVVGFAIRKKLGDDMTGKNEPGNRQLHLMGEAELSVWLKSVHDRQPEIDRRLSTISRAAVGTPFAPAPLGEGAEGKLKKAPRIDLRNVDCVTYVEQSLALALPGALVDRLKELDRIRYADGVVSFTTRNHYFVADWIRANRWLLRDVTEDVGGDSVRTEHRTIDYAAFFSGQGADYEGPASRKVSTGVIPRDASFTVRLPEGEPLIVVFIQQRDGIFARHVGVVEDGMLRHASSERKMVIEESLAGYIENHKWVSGIKLLQLAR